MLNNLIGKEPVLQTDNQQYLQEDIATLRTGGNDDAASVMQRLIDDGDRLTSKVLEYLPGADGEHDEARKHVLQRGIVSFLVMALLCSLGASMSAELGLVMLFFTVTVVLAFVYAYDAVTNEELVDQRLLAVLILMSFALAMLATIGLFV